MKVKLATAFLILFIAVSCNNRNVSTAPQSTEMDSLLIAYRNDIQSDPIHTIHKIKLTQKTVEDSTVYYKLYTILAIGYFMDNKIDSAFICDRNVIRFCLSQNEDNLNAATLISNAYNDMSVFFQVTGQIDSTIVYLEKAAAAATKFNEATKLLDIYANLADGYNQKSNFSAAAGYYRKALFIADSLNLQNEIDILHTGLAHVYTDLKNFKEADYYFMKIEHLIDSLPDYEKYLFSNTRGNYYYGKHEYEKALFWIKKANSMARLFTQGSYRAITEANLGEIFLLLNRPDSAKYYLDKAAVYFFTDEAAHASKFYLSGLYGRYYLNMNDLAKAKIYLSHPCDTPNVNPLYIYYNTRHLEELYKKRGDFKNAYNLSLLAKAYDDSVRNITIQNNIAEIDSRYRQDTIVLKRDIQLAQKESDLMKMERNNILILSFFIVIIMIAVAVAICRQKKRKLQQIHQITEVAKLRMDSIRNRISPHLMFNVLNVVVPNLREHKTFARPMQLLIELIRESLTLSDKLAMPLDDEIRIVKNYQALISSMQPDSPGIQWEISPDVDLKTFVPSMILQIPVENAIKYAFDEHEGEKLLVVKIFISNNDLSLEVQDNGIGFNAERTSNRVKGTGSGLKILYKTIEMLNVVNNRKIEFEIKNKVNISADGYGTGVFIKIPLNYKYEL